MSEIKHTPLPWVDIEADEYAGASWINIYVPQTNKFLVSQHPVEVHATDDDLAFIVRACNIHYKLLEALKDCRNAMYADNPADGWAEIIAAADAAISKAGEE